MKIRIAGYENDSIVDGSGLRFALFTQGCPHRCEGCHNPQTHDFAGGADAETGELIAKLAANPLLDGLTLSGGEPFAQAEACAELARGARELGINVWIYTGYTFERLISENQIGWRALLEASDVLVDGAFVLAERTLDIPFIGSRNQRILDVAASLRAGTPISA